MSNETFIIAGLGNPGRKYENTRHNLGFITVDKIAEDNDISVKKIKFKSLVGEGVIGSDKVILMKPQTFMNNSGEALREIVNFYKVPPENLIVIYDDFDIPIGSIRVRKFGSAGTHNGMRSVIRLLGFDNFPRIRIGIDSAIKNELINFVTGGFRKEEVPLLEEAVTNGAAAAETIVTKGIDLAMNRYNTKKTREKDE
ncbi:aminoacyl-tRNA hydrolase [Eubacterium minutum ATCC 700079]|nr:aminoacyl-tRNA hydrolase [Eubacterium minutum ATCC 700079]